MCNIIPQRKSVPDNCVGTVSDTVLGGQPILRWVFAVPTRPQGGDVVPVVAVAGDVSPDGLAGPTLEGEFQDATGPPITGEEAHRGTLPFRHLMGVGAHADPSTSMKYHWSRYSMYALGIPAFTIWSIGYQFSTPITASHQARGRL